MIPLWMMPLAVVADNTFVLKPSERTLLGAVQLAEHFQEAGFPPGVLNVVHGARETVEALITALEVKAVSVSARRRWHATSTRRLPAMGMAVLW